MNFQLIGVNHNTAPVEVRERLAIPESRLAEALKRLAEHPGVDEALILSTCNRAIATRRPSGRATSRRRAGRSAISSRTARTSSRSPDPTE